MANPVDLQGNALNLSVQQIPIDISLRSATRVRNHDLFMLFSLWMEKHPRDPPTPPPNSELWFESSSTISPTLGGNGHGAASNERTAASYAALRTGAVLVDSADRVVSIDRTGESHAAVRCLMTAAIDIRGCDLYISRFPCALCIKIAVQAGVRKIYYFPAEKWELAVDESTHQFHKNENILQLRQREHERAEQNRRSVMRLVSNNSIALTLFIPQWDHGDMDNDSPSELTSERPDHQLLQTSGLEQLYTWPLDHALENSPGIARRYPVIVQKFARTTLALNAVARRYNVEAIGLDEWRNRYIPSNDRATADFAYTESVSNNAKDASLKTLDDLDSRVQLPYWARHAMVLAHIAAKRTDDPKLGVGSVFVDEGEGRYFSIGWNGYPKKSQHLDYPQSGADDSVEYEELKYDYILHSEQNALLWRNSQGVRVREAWVVVTKMPCDECSPMLADVGIRKCITIPQQPKNHDDPSRLRGLTYSRVAGLMKLNGVATPGSPTVARTRSRHVASRYLAHRTPAPVPVLANQKGAAAVALATTKRSKQTTAAIAAATATAMATVAKPVTLSVFKTSMSTRQLRSLTVSGTVASPRRMLRSGTSALRNKPPKFNLPASTSDQLENIPSESASLAAELHRASQPSSKLRQNSALPKTPFIATKKNNLKNNPNPPSPKITDQQETNEPLIVARQTVAHSSPSNNYGATHAISIKQQSSAAIFQYPPGSHQLQQQIHRFSQDPDPFIPTQPSRILAEHLPFLLSSTHGNQKSGVDDREADALLADAQLLQWRLLTAKAKHSFEIRKIEAERQIFQGWQCIQSIKSQIHDLKSEIAARKRMMRDLDALVIQETNLKSIITAIQHFESDYSSLVRGLEASVVRMKMLNVHLSNPVELRDSLIHGTNRINKILESGKTVFSKVQTLTEATTALTRLAAAGKTELAECIDLMTQVSIMKAKEQSYLIEAEQLKSQHS